MDLEFVIQTILVIHFLVAILPIIVVLKNPLITPKRRICIAIFMIAVPVLGTIVGFAYYKNHSLGHDSTYNGDLRTYGADGNDGGASR